MQQQPYAYQPSPRTSSTAIVALVLAISSFVVCPVVAPIVALVLASTANREIAESGGWITGEGLVSAAKIIAWINLAIFTVVLLLFAILLTVSR